MMTPGKLPELPLSVLLYSVAHGFVSFFCYLQCILLPLTQPFQPRLSGARVIVRGFVCLSPS